jgi:hypothetical protein
MNVVIDKIREIGNRNKNGGCYQIEFSISEWDTFN